MLVGGVGFPFVRFQFMLEDHTAQSVDERLLRKVPNASFVDLYYGN